ncbi:fluoride efflux transporter FluC [Flaviflexus massiliensis]|uniref:fluoride efflux transporter FluC n=1 Tax=Flaviflexus massiliensis TaxID=1522309 RepID=UPI00097D672E|nr:CrcB family protein [Flaviflexus massiliensis]
MTHLDFPRKQTSAYGRSSLTIGSRWFFQALLVFLGGCLGTASRHAVTLALPDTSPSLSLFVVNVVGSFLLGLLMDLGRLRGQSRQRYQHYRLLLGTGFLGSFTTYSAFALANAQLITDNQIGTVLAYGFGMVITGVLAALLGILLGQVAKPDHSQDTTAKQGTRKAAQNPRPATMPPAVQQIVRSAPSPEATTSDTSETGVDRPSGSSANNTASKENTSEGRKN